MRIGLDGFPLLSPRTGVGHYTFELARALALLAPSDQFELVAPQPFPDTVLREIQLNGCENLRAITPEIGSIGRRRWWAIGLPHYLKHGSLDLFHGTNYEVPLWNKRRSVLTIHDLSVLTHADKYPPQGVRRARRRLPLMVRSAGMIITPSETVKREVVDKFGVQVDRIVVTPEAPRHRFQPLDRDKTIETKRRLGVEDDFILFVGTIEPRKNLPTLLRACEQILRRTRNRPQLVIAGGEGWLTDNLFSGLQSPGIKDRLCLTGYLTDDDLCALYSSCSVFAYPSVYEGFGLPPLEAMACGAPVVASRIPVFEETLGSAACLIDPMDAEALAASIVKILDDEDCRQELSSRSRERAAKFSWKCTARLTMEVYRQFLEKTFRH